MPAANWKEYQSEYDKVTQRQKVKLPTLVAVDARSQASVPVPSGVPKPAAPKDAAKKPSPKPSNAPKNEIQAKVAEKVLKEPLPIDKDKKDFSESQARRTTELETEIVTSAKAIREYESAIKNWPLTRKGNES